ncbi:UDP-N-acetyl glucosamine 2-epimerase [Propioniciclava coleopterorum]|uniref:UDP-N-acetyl glucosamine 2-epimerase n=1 Tax=Propioniciclava coleopterorum TaxID=2714937 RepID=A0A6G7Y512_9ACTN|nr:UDP-N-acetylglucosamine 2-epimerase [Propioniciclava coleopterorum]QIK71728.1 UDP-N-acetyl glucosamine 2-epimerase [Propioniciclava coleopterorum]
MAGTTAELIKLSPVMTQLTDRGVPFELWSTSQHVTGVDESLADLRMRTPDRYLLAERHRRHIVASRQVPGWMLRLGAAALRRRRELQTVLRTGGGRGTIVVHGDTFSTVLGSMLGRFLGARVAHVEAGLRSGHLLNPLPEEMNRRIVGKLATMHFAPTPREVDNLRKAKAPGDYVLTGANTVVDALHSVDKDQVDGVNLPDHFGLVTLHRFELLRDGDHFSDLLRLLARRSVDYPLVMVLGHAERTRITELGLDGLFSETFTNIDKRPYAKFLPVLARADFVVTDSGGLQEECAALGIPCAVHRERTERHQGLGENVLLDEMDLGRLDRYLSEWRDYRREPQSLAESPSSIIAERLTSAV